MITKQTKRKCSRCKIPQALDEFHRNRNMPLGRTYLCKSCYSKYHKKYHKRIYATEEGREHLLEKVRRFYKTAHGKRKAVEKVTKYRETEAGKQLQRQCAARYRKNHPHKIAAHAKLRSAVRSGKIIRPHKCQVNGHNCHGEIEAHHDDYFKPFDIEWFCVYHHNKIPSDLTLKASVSQTPQNPSPAP